MKQNIYCSRRFYWACSISEGLHLCCKKRRIHLRVTVQEQAYQANAERANVEHSLEQEINAKSNHSSATKSPSNSGLLFTLRHHATKQLCGDVTIRAHLSIGLLPTVLVYT